jgi:hypothetical protein
MEVVGMKDSGGACATVNCGFKGGRMTRSGRVGNKGSGRKGKERGRRNMIDAAT